jgi:hypothetical protein
MAGVPTPTRAGPGGQPFRGGSTGFRRGRPSWAQEIETTTAALDTRVQLLAQRRPPPGVTEEERAILCEGARQLIDAARQAARGEDPRYRWFRSWWRGTNTEAAFRKCHRAASELLELSYDAEVEAEVPTALGRAEVSLNREDPVRDVARQLPTMPPGPLRRMMLAKVVQCSHDAADNSMTRLRNFRNVVLVTSFCMLVLVIAFSVAVALDPTIVPLCFRQQASAVVACPTGDGPEHQPAALDVVVVAMLGLLGGALAAAVSIRNLRGTETPYDVPIALALLKVPAGALTAIGALIAIRGNFVPGLSALDTQVQILAYALVFGYAQQLLTGLIDRQARQLLDAVPSKDADQSRPPLQPPVVPPPVAGVQANVPVPRTDPAGSGSPTGASAQEGAQGTG